MKKKGLTLLEIMIAVGIFLVMAVFVVKLDINTSKEIGTIKDRMTKSQIAQGELERIKSNPAGELDRLKSNPHYKIEKTVDGYLVTISGSGSSTYSLIAEVAVTVMRDSTDTDPYIMKAHVLLK
jgi:prepilin-type N-terminal cleavage/methylation domain-containing protein